MSGSNFIEGGWTPQCYNKIKKPSAYRVKNNRRLLCISTGDIPLYASFGTCTFYVADNGDEMRAKVNSFSKLYDISMNKAKTVTALSSLTDFFFYNEHKL